MKKIAFGTLRFDRRSIPPDLTDIRQWPGADDSALSDDWRDLLTRRIRAMTLFVDGHTPLREIVERIKSVSAPGDRQGVKSGSL